MSTTHVSLVLVPDVIASTLTGMYDVLTCFPSLATIDADVPRQDPFEVEVVGLNQSAVGPSGLTLSPHRSFSEVSHTDVVIAPALMVEGGSWVTGRYPDGVTWLRDMHDDGAILASACSGVLLLAETGLLDGLEATIHWAYARTFRENFPDVPLHQEKVLVASGDRERFVMSGASAGWHDLVLYVVARIVGPTAAQAIAKFMMLQWHRDGQAPYQMFSPNRGHGDAAVLDVQEWLIDNFTATNPVEQMVNRSGLAERTFKRRFKQATDHSPIEYLQQVRVHEAKRMLERTDLPVEQISWTVGYADPTSFRRIFRRLTGVSPAAYRRNFSLPDLPGLNR